MVVVDRTGICMPQSTKEKAAIMTSDTDIQYGEPLFKMDRQESICMTYAGRYQNQGKISWLKKKRKPIVVFIGGDGLIKRSVILNLYSPLTFWTTYLLISKYCDVLFFILDPF